MENINFRGIPTSLFLNGPNLEIVNNPQNATNVIGVATFTGIATATAADELDGGSIDFKWYYNGSQLLDTSEDYTSVASISTFDTPTGTGSTMTIVGQNSDLNGKEVYFTVDYNPSAYQSESPVTAGTARSTANAPNEPLQSTIATISVQPEIEITSQPDPASVLLNETASYSIEARTIPGNGPVNYQWQLDGNNLVDGSTSTIVQETSTGIITATIGGTSTTIDFSEVSSYDQFTPGQIYTLTTDRDIIVRVHLEGGSGGNDQHYNTGGGTGGLAVGTITLLQGQSYQLIVGERGNDSYIPQDSRYNQTTDSQGGYPGGGDGNGGNGGGGGYTGLFLSSITQANSLIIAGGAGGGGTFRVDGGDGGGLNGENGEESGNPDGSGNGGTQTVGGTAGAPGGEPGGALLLLNGTNGGSGGGGGGGGYYGGGGGALRDLYMSGSGGGGSSYFSNVVSDTTTTTGGAAGGDGYARIDVVSSPKTVTTVVSGSQTNNLLIRTDDNAAGTIRCSVSANNVQQSPVFSRSVSYYSYTARNVLNIEQYDYTNSSATLTSHNLANGTLTLNNASYPGNDICIYAPEKDIEVEIDMHGGRGDTNNNRSWDPGDGGYSRIRFTMNKNEEYILTGLFSSINAPFLYRKSSLIAVVGGGGDAGDESGGGGYGGDGGGISLAGVGGGGLGGGGGTRFEPGQLPENGIFSRMVAEGTAIEPDGYREGALQTFGGRVRPCTRGVYWREQGKAPCEDLGTIKFRIPDGTELSNTAEIDRGYKSGYNIIQTKGQPDSTNDDNVGGLAVSEGGAGAEGGSGGLGNGGGGGGGSGYTDGSVEVLSTQLGGSQYTNATIIISQLTPVSVTQDIVDNRGTTSEVSPFSITRYITPGLSGTEGHPVGSILYTVNILDYTNPTLTARVLNTSLRGSGLTDPNNSIAVSAGYPRMVSANTFEVAFDMISSQNANERQATFVRNFELTMTANVSNFGN